MVCDLDLCACSWSAAFRCRQWCRECCPGPGRASFRSLPVVAGVDQTVGARRAKRLGAGDGTCPRHRSRSRSRCRHFESRHHASVRMSRAVWTLSTASRAFSRAIKLAEEPASWLRPMTKTPAMLSSPVARIAIAIIVSISEKPASSPPTVGSSLVRHDSLHPLSAIPSPRVNQRRGAHDRDRPQRCSS